MLALNAPINKFSEK